MRDTPHHHIKQQRIKKTQHKSTQHEIKNNITKQIAIHRNKYSTKQTKTKTHQRTTQLKKTK